MCRPAPAVVATSLLWANAYAGAQARPGRSVACLGTTLVVRSTSLTRSGLGGAAAGRGSCNCGLVKFASHDHTHAPNKGSKRHNACCDDPADSTHAVSGQPDCFWGELGNTTFVDDPPRGITRTQRKQGQVQEGVSLNCVVGWTITTAICLIATCWLHAQIVPAGQEQSVLVPVSEATAACTAIASCRSKQPAGWYLHVASC